MTGPVQAVTFAYMTEAEKPRSWYKLDNAGKLYPALLNQRDTTLFRMTARMDNTVNVTRLNRALENIMVRFPYYNVHLMRGAFWYYFDESPRLPRAERDSRYPCMKMAVRKRTRFPFRVRAWRNRISIEYSHILTDGTGGFTFFTALLGEYTALGEGREEPYEGILHKSETPHREEFEDAFVRYLDKDIPQPRREQKAFQYPGPKEARGVYWVTTGSLPYEDLAREAKSRSLTITEFLTALLMEVFQDYLFDLEEGERKRKAAPIAICIPVNLRRIFPSRTMRNFFLSVTPYIDPRLGRYSFEEICDKVMHFMRTDMDRKFLSQQITRNVKGEMNLLARLLPVHLKDLFLPIVYRTFGKSTYTTTLSNMGQITLPPEVAAHVKSIHFTPNPPSGKTKIKVGVCGYGNRVNITFGRVTPSSRVEREFFRKIRRLGIPVKVESNIS
ncbi:MAG: hypothetical protein PQJ59_08310 [Spirochaetales bacterium]|nr:hypothetical protein [Spirochaetales bacterium]